MDVLHFFVFRIKIRDWVIKIFVCFLFAYLIKLFVESIRISYVSL